ncbi:flagellar export chaperone FliS [Pseudidiomarina sp. CB1]|uniref:flagellar export chaperone FliS n=1 Tax=Pseudidiomarina sp. CB1 TaxID=2972484 RepID=UPI0021621CFB|nr:flagellar export chaperone FliS [Pseudidiomarina sp. CB1]
MYGMRGAAAYGRVNVESHVLSASPHKLIELLFENCLRQIKTARAHLAQKQVSAKGEAIGKALDIVNQGLLAAVDKDKGGEVAERLESLYLYVGDLLVQANLHNDASKLDTAETILSQLAGAWKEIATEAAEA